MKTTEENKVLLVLVDGMRPDCLDALNHPRIRQMKEEGSYSYSVQTVMPSVTLPCHMSLFHSVPPERHGVTTNTFMPQVRPINGLCEQLKLARKTSAMFYNWGALKDLYQPGSVACACFLSGYVHSYRTTNLQLTEKAVQYIRESAPDFLFLYLGNVDEVGHDHGWMSPAYRQAVSESWDCIDIISQKIPRDYTVIVTADHGGHDRSHGTDSPEDMIIPLFLKGPDFAPGANLGHASILDIAPTIARVLSVDPAPEWEGKALV